MLSMIVIVVIGTGDKVVYRPGSSKECSRIPTSGGGSPVADAVIEARALLGKRR